MRLFSTPEGDAGFALKGDDIVSVFKHPEAPYRHVTRSMLDLAVGQGGRRLDAFDTVLPRFYSQSGFRAVARTPFNDQYKPEGWDYSQFKAHNGGRPDVVFMAHDPQAGLYQPWDGARIADYDEGARHQDAALAEVERRGNVPAAPGPESYGSGQLIRMGQGATPQTIWHGTPHEFPPTRANPLGEFDISKIGTGEGNQAYAYGPYAAGNEAVAKGYRNDLSGGVTYRGGHWMGLSDPQYSAVQAVADAMEERGMTPEQAIEHMRQAHETAASSAMAPMGGLIRTDVQEENHRRGLFHQSVADALERLNPADFVHNKGNLYQAELHIHPDHMLDWDKPIEQHSPYVQERLRDVILKGVPHQTGEFIHGILADPTYGNRDKTRAAMELLRRGIPGVRYADQNSRRHVEEAYQIRRNAPFSPESMDESERRAREAESKITHNYVVFDPRTINIVRRNGLPAMVEAGADALRDHKRNGGGS